MATSSTSSASVEGRGATSAGAAFEQARERFLEGVRALEQGRPADAERSLVASLALLPGRPSTLLNLAVARLQLGQAASALQLLDEMLALEPASADAWGHRGLALTELGRWEEALECFDRVLQADPDNAAAALQRAALLGLRGRRESSLAELCALLSRHPAYVQAWVQQGLLLQALERPHDALQAYERAIGLDDQCGQAHGQRGGILKDVGRLPEAARSLRRAIGLGADVAVNSFLLASIEKAAAPPQAPREYVQGLFDNYAEQFDTHLQQQLQYRAPEQLQALLPGGRRFDAALDLGCGTGLCAPGLAPRSAALDGVDLSPRMLEQAHVRGLYRRLVQADLAQHLQGCEERYDVVVAADVFIYVGELEATFAGVSRVLLPGGWFVFSVEECAAPERFALTTASRFAHSAVYLQELATRHGFVLQALQRGTLRQEQGRPIAGLFMAMTRV